MSSSAVRQGAPYGLAATIGWSLLVAAAFLALQFATLFAFAAAGHVSDASAASGTLIAVASIVTGVCCTALVAGIVKLKKESGIVEYLRLYPVAPATVFRWLAITIALIALSDFVTVSIGRPLVPEFMRAVYPTADPVALLWIGLVLAAPLFEETFFRGFLFAGLEASRLGAAGAVLVTAAVWAGIHLQYDAYEMTLILCLGIALGLARLATRSLYVPLAMHATMNFVATLETALIVG